MRFMCLVACGRARGYRLCNNRKICCDGHRSICPNTLLLVRALHINTSVHTYVHIYFYLYIKTDVAKVIGLNSILII